VNNQTRFYIVSRSYKLAPLHIHKSAWIPTSQDTIAIDDIT